MSQNTVQTFIKVNSSQAIGQFNNLGASIRNNVAIGNLFASALTKGLDLVASAAGGVVGQFSEMSSLRLENIGAAGDLARATGLSFEESQKDIAQFTIEMAKMAKDLPGTASDFSAIGISLSDNLAGGLKDLNGELDIEAFKEYRAEFAKFGAMRTQFSGVQLADTNMFISKLLDGRSMAELKTLKFAEANVGVIAELERQLGDSGKELKEFSKRELIDLAQTAMKVEDEVIEAARQSTAGLFAGFKDGLFNPNVGIFGIAKDLNDTLEGDQSAFAEFEEIVRSILGPDGTFALVGELLAGAGLSEDAPMQMLADGLNGVNEWIGKLNSFLGGEGLGDFDLSSSLGDFGGFIADIYNKGLEALSGIDWLAVAGIVGEGIAGIFNALFNFLADIDLTQVAGLVLKLGVATTAALGTALAGIDWGAVGIVLLKVGAVALAALGVAVAAAVAGVGAAGVAVFGTLALGVIAAIGSVREYFAGRVTPIKDAVNDIVSAIGSLFRGLVEKIQGALSFIRGQEFNANTVGQGGAARRVQNKATGLDQMGIFAAIAREKAAAPAAQPIIANSSELILNQGQQLGLAQALNGRKPAPFNFNGNIVIQGGANPKQQADQIIDEMGRRWESYQRSKMGLSY